METALIGFCLGVLAMVGVMTLATISGELAERARRIRVASMRSRAALRAVA